MTVTVKTKYRNILELNGLYFQAEIRVPDSREPMLKFSANLADAYKWEYITEAEEKRKELARRLGDGIRLLKMDVLTYRVWDAVAEAKAPPERIWT